MNTSSYPSQGVPRDKTDLVRSLYEQRLRAVVGQLRATMSGLTTDPVFQTLAADPASASFLPVRTAS